MENFTITEKIKQQRKQINEEIQKLEEETKKDLINLRQSLKKQIEKERTGLEAEIVEIEMLTEKEVKLEVIKTILILLIGMIIGMGIMKLEQKLMLTTPNQQMNLIYKTIKIMQGGE